MKTLTLIRHAKSDHSDPTILDIDRPLSSRGERVCDLLSQILSRLDITPDIALVSPAARTRQTIRALRKSLSLKKKQIQIIDSLFTLTKSDSGTSFLAQLCGLDASIDHSLIVGHNPGLSEIISTLSHTTIGLGTGGLVILSLDLDSWSNLSETTLVRVLFSIEPSEWI